MLMVINLTITYKISDTIKGIVIFISNPSTATELKYNSIAYMQPYMRMCAQARAVGNNFYLVNHRHQSNSTGTKETTRYHRLLFKTQVSI